MKQHRRTSGKDEGFATAGLRTICRGCSFGGFQPPRALPTYSCLTAWFPRLDSFINMLKALPKISCVPYCREPASHPRLQAQLLSLPLI